MKRKQNYQGISMPQHREISHTLEEDYEEIEDDKDFTVTTNGAIAYSQSHFLKNDQSALVALNISIATKTDFKTGLQYLEKIMKNSNKISKVYAIILLMHIRDIEFGKGLRKPFLEGMTYLFKNGYSKLACELISEVPEMGYYKDLCNLYDISQSENIPELEKCVVETYKNGLKYEFELKGQFGMRNCAKFAPRQQKKYGKFAAQLSKSLFPDSKCPQKDYRKYIQQIMQKYSQITEVLMSSQRWDEIDPKFVPSLCFQKYKKCFLNTEQNEEKKQILKDKYEQHINDALEGKNGAKINAKRLNVDTIVPQFQSVQDPLQLKALEAQFQDIVNDLKKKGGLLKKCVCMCDVSGSMSGNPLQACIGLGVAINELNEGLYSHSIMTFSADPVWVELGDAMTYKEKIDKVSQSQWGMNTDFFKAMKLVANLTDDRENLPQAIFVFSDMQFDMAGGGQWGTTMDRITQYYINQGFEESDVPTIIFWNLRAGTDSFAVDTHQKKVICLSGYSQNLVKAIAQAPNIDYIMSLSPFTFLLEVLDNKRYQKIKQIAMDNIEANTTVF